GRLKERFSKRGFKSINPLKRGCLRRSTATRCRPNAESTPTIPADGWREPVAAPRELRVAEIHRQRRNGVGLPCAARPGGYVSDPEPRPIKPISTEPLTARPGRGAGVR